MNKLLKKLFFCILLMSLFVGISACSGVNQEASAEDGGRLHIVISVFPVYDWLVNVLGAESENVEVTLLVDNGTDLHSFQPSAKDLVEIADCDLFIYIGGESDEWVSEAVSQYENPDRLVISLIDLLGDAAKTEELVEGMQEESSGWLSGLFGGEEEEETDEHVWLSLRNAALFTAEISEALSQADPACADEYAENADGYIAQLQELDEAYSEAAEDAGTDTLLFADRFAFRYLTDDYGLDYYAAFPGCSAETQASFETILFLAEKLDELGLKYVMLSESGDTDIADTIIESTAAQDAQILVLDSMQSVTAKDIAGGTTYLGIMEENLEVLRQALE